MDRLEEASADFDEAVRLSPASAAFYRQVVPKVSQLVVHARG